MRLLTAISLALVTLVALAMGCVSPAPPPTATPLPYLAFQLDVRISPNDAAIFMLNPSPLGKGGYAQGMVVTIDILPNEGWEIEEWIGPAFNIAGRTAQIQMDSSQSVAVRLKLTTPPTPTPTDTLTPTDTPTPTAVSSTAVGAQTLPPQSGTATASGPVKQFIDVGGARIAQYSSVPPVTIDTAANYTAVMRTSLGNMEIELFAAEAPVTVNNFIFLAIEGFYDGVVFHRVIPSFMIQGGDPLGRGTGGPGYKFHDEFVPSLTFDQPGKLAMANSGPATNGSQFFVTVAPTPHLNGAHTIFGQITQGQNVADAISLAQTGPSNNPVTPIVILGIDIAKNP